MNRKEIIQKLRSEKYTFQQIGNLLGISRQRVHQIFNHKWDYGFCRPYEFARKNVCVLCGRTKEKVAENSKSKSRLHVHHLDNDNKNNDPNNLVTLCCQCHSEVHRSTCG